VKKGSGTFVIDREFDKEQIGLMRQDILTETKTPRSDPVPPIAALISVHFKFGYFP